MCDLIFVAEAFNIASFADDTTPYVFPKDIDPIIKKQVKANEIFE